MQLACPTCGKSNSASPCERCGSDLAVLLQIPEYASNHLAHGAALLQQGQAAPAYTQALHSWKLRHTPQAAKLAALAAIALGDFTSALHWRSRTDVKSGPA